MLHLYINMINKNNNSSLVFRARFSNLVGLQISLPTVRFVITISEQVIGVAVIRGIKTDHQLVKVFFFVFLPY